MRGQKYCVFCIGFWEDETIFSAAILVLTSALHALRTVLHAQK